MKSWYQKIQFLYASSLQIKRALNSDDPNELILGYSSGAIALETFVNFYTPQHLTDKELREMFGGLKLYQKIRFLPRFSKGPTTDVLTYEASTLHAKYRKIISYRNSLVHGSLEKFDLSQLSKGDLLSLWNSIIDLFIELVSVLQNVTVVSLKQTEDSFENLKFILNNGIYESKFLDKIK